MQTHTNDGLSTYRTTIMLECECGRLFKNRIALRCYSVRVGSLSIWHFDLALRAMSQDSLIAKMKESLSQMQRLDVVHKDPALRNWSYNPESKKGCLF